MGVRGLDPRRWPALRALVAEFRRARDEGQARPDQPRTDAARRGLRILIVAPRYPPQTGGAATYTAILASFLQKHQAVGRVGVLTWSEPGQPWVERQARLTIYRLLPVLDRDGHRSRPLRLGSRLLAEAVLAVFLIVMSAGHRYDLVHVHASLSRIGGRIRALLLEACLLSLRLPAVLDLRDLLVRPSTGNAWRMTICPARSVYRRARASGIPTTCCVYLPVPIDSAAIRSAAGSAAAARFAAGRSYLLYAGEISAWKGVAELAAAFHTYKRTGADPALALVLIGPIAPRRGDEATWPAAWEGDPDVFYLGPRSWHETIAAIAGCALLVTPSHRGREALPRVCLEALALRRKVLFPAAIDEFSEVCPDWIARDLTPAGLAMSIARALHRCDLPVYDLSAHEAGQVFERYIQLYQQLARR